MNVKYLIIGGGVSGLTFANQVKTDDYLIVEKESELGGFCRTIKRNGFVWDYAGHFFHFANEEIKSFFEKEMDKEALVFHKKNTKIWYADKMIDYPFQKNIHQLPKEEFIDCLYDLYFKDSKEAYTDFEDMLYGKFGESITNKFLKPYNEKLYATRLNNLDVDAMGRFFPYADFEEVMKNMKAQENSSYNDMFSYPKDGAQMFIEILTSKLDKDKILLNSEVTSIDYDKKIAYVNGTEIHYEELINTIPLTQLVDRANLTEQFDTQAFTYNKVLVLNLGFDAKSKYDDIHWVYFPDKATNFYRIGFYDNILNSDRLSLYVEIGYSSEDEILVEEQLQATLDNLKAIGIIDDQKLVDWEPIVMTPAYVHVSEKSNELKKNIIEFLKEKNIHSIGRYGDWKYCSIEDSMIDAIKLAKQI